MMTKQTHPNDQWRGYTLREIQSLSWQVADEIDAIKTGLRTRFDADVVAPYRRRSYMFKKILSGVVIARYSYQLYKLFRKARLLYRAYSGKKDEKA